MKPVNELVEAAGESQWAASGSRKQESASPLDHVTTYSICHSPYYNVLNLPLADVFLLLCDA